MGIYQKLLKRIDERDYITEREHREYLKELESMAKLIDDLISGNMISYNGKFVAMNKNKYHEYREKQLVSAEAVAFIQARNEELENMFKKYIHRIQFPKEINKEI